MAVTVRKNQFAGSIGAGMKSLLNPGGRTYYVLEHKLSTTKHKAGEKQEVIIDYIEIGRDHKCQVQFDDLQATVSRKHAAILKEEGNWKLRQLSQTNETLLNGRPIKNEWYLQSGDEIQLSVGGPKLGFIVPSNNTVGSIGLTRRMSLFRQQALRPYKTAITTLAVVLLCFLIGGGYIMINQQSRIEDLVTDLNANVNIISGLENTLEGVQTNTQQEIDNLNKKLKSQTEQNTALEARLKKAIEEQAGGGYSVDAIQSVLDRVYFLVASKVELHVPDGETVTVENWGWSGTAFLLDDGRFVTARHCVFGWKYPSDEKGIKLNCFAAAGYQVVAYFDAYSSSGKHYTFKSTDFVTDDSGDTAHTYGTDDSGNTWRGTAPSGNHTDWAYMSTSLTGGLKSDVQLSSSLRSGTNLILVGYPKGLGASSSEIDPVVNTMMVSQNGLNADGCIMISNSVDHGNSGGPVFASKNGELTVIGIVSRGDSRSEKYAHLVPVSALQ